MGSSRYDPFGNAMAQSGATSVFAFAGEQYDAATGLEYLRARYYSAAQGRFTTRDPWEGNIALPGTLDHWAYVRDNPVNYLDPSGRIEQGAEADRAKIIETYLQDMYQVVIQHDWGSYSITIPASPHTPVTTRDCWQPGAWKIKDLELVREGVDLAAGADGLQNKGKFLKAMKGKVYISRWDKDWGSMAPPPPLNIALGDVVLTNSTFSNIESYARHVVIHELAHVWDHRSNHQLSFGMMKALNTTFFDFGTGTYIWDPYANPELPAGANPSCTVAEIAQGKSGCYVPYAFTYGAGSLLEGPGWEDWADSFASVAYSQYRTDIKQTNVATGGIRETYVRAQINAVR